jgi:hypothetical protein
MVLSIEEHVFISAQRLSERNVEGNRKSVLAACITANNSEGVAKHEP